VSLPPLLGIPALRIKHFTEKNKFHTKPQAATLFFGVFFCFVFLKKEIKYTVHLLHWNADYTAEIKPE